VIDIEPSGDPVPILLERRGRSPFDESVAAGLVGLTYLAKQAYEDRRRRQCLEFTTEILKIDPEHAEARTILESVRSELERDFASARAIAHEAHAKGDRTLFGQATAALRKIVDADPENLEAQALLHETVAAGYFSPSSPRRRLGRRSLLMGSVAAMILAGVLVSRIGTNSRVLAYLPPEPAVAAHTESRSQSSQGTLRRRTRCSVRKSSWDGVRLTPIGQTPLGDVNVPIGSVLVFQSPGFSDKRYRVTAGDASIQVTFP
jgi:hypothetical protein